MSPPRVLSLLLLVAVARCAAQQPAALLRDGEAFQARGHLGIVYRGWQPYLLLRLDRAYTADFGPATPEKSVTALELRAPGQSATLAEHAGEAVEVTGTLQLSSASPFFFNGVALLAQTVTLPGGTVLQSQRPQPRVPAGTDLYLVSVAIVPHQFEWRREAHDTETGDLLPDPAVDGCSLDGAADRVNCLCIPGFTPIRAGLVPQPLPATRWREVPIATYALPGMAQFVLPGPATAHSQIVEVACRRTPRHMEGSLAK